jgi:3-hydroxyisobutyrate dehydrogenase-like beta-hydroxyacid dehydrogenase
MKVGIIGLGQMGSGLAASLLKARGTCLQSDEQRRSGFHHAVG